MNIGLRKISFKSDFVKNVLTLMTGTTIAQIIPLVISPILTRTYSPQDFGIFAAFMSIVSILFVIATGRFELAVMLPEKDEDAVNVLALTVLISLVVSLFTLLIVWLFNEHVTSLIGNPGISKWLYFIPPMLFLTGLYLALSYWSNRKRHYERLALSDIILKTSSEGSKLYLGINRLLGNGLIAGTVFGQFFASCVLGWQIWKEDGKQIQHIGFGKILSFARLYKRFPLYTLPYSLIANFSNEFLILALTSFNYLPVVGFLGFTRRLMIAPIGFLSASLGRVFFQEAVTSMGTPRLEQLALSLMLKITDLFAPVFVVIMFWAPLIFKYVFGAAWLEAGRYASVLAPSAFLFLFTSWPERIYEIAQKQHISFLIQLLSDIVRVVLVWVMLYEGVRPFYCIAAYSLASCVYHCAYLLGIFSIARFKLHSLYAVLKKTLFLGVAFSCMLYIIDTAAPSILSRFLAGACLLVIYYLYWTLNYFKVLKTAGHKSAN